MESITTPQYLRLEGEEYDDEQPILDPYDIGNAGLDDASDGFIALPYPHREEEEREGEEVEEEGEIDEDEDERGGGRRGK